MTSKRKLPGGSCQPTPHSKKLKLSAARDTTNGKSELFNAKMNVNKRKQCDRSRTDKRREKGRKLKTKKWNRVKQKESGLEGKAVLEQSTRVQEGGVKVERDKTVTTHRSTGSDVKESAAGEKATLLTDKACVAFPTNANDVSANWKLVQQQICGSKRQESKSEVLKKKKLRQKKKSERVKTKTHAENAANGVTNKRPEIWFDGVDPILLEASNQADSEGASGVENQSSKESNSQLVKQNSFPGLTRVVAMDCEMVGVGEGGKDSILARVSLVNNFGNCIYDKFVRPREEVTDYRTHVSGVRPQDLKTAEDFSVVQKEVADILEGRILVGHALHNDLQVLYLTHPRNMIRDTQCYKPFRALFNGGRPSLKKLTAKVLAVQVQQGAHSSVQDAQAAMRLYTMYKKDWEKEVKLQKPNQPKNGKRKRNCSRKHKKKPRLNLNLDT